MPVGFCVSSRVAGSIYNFPAWTRLMAEPSNLFILDGLDGCESKSDRQKACEKMGHGYRSEATVKPSPTHFHVCASG